MKSIFYGASNPSAFDGSMLLPPGDAIFPGTIMSVQFDDLLAPPINGQVITNRAWRQFAKLTGRDEGDEAECHSTFVVGSDATPDKLKLALTPMGGLYGSPSHSSGGANTRAYVSASAAVKQYILDVTIVAGANPTDTAQPWNVEGNHPIGHLIWLTMNRAGRTDGGKTGQNVVFYRMAGTGNSIISATQAITSPAYPITGTENTGMTGTSGTLVGNFADPPMPMVADVAQMRYAASRGWFTSKPATPADFDCICGFGPLPGQSASGFLQSAPSFALYRWDIIDLRHAVSYGEAKAFRGIGAIDFRHTLSDLYEPRNQLTSAKRRAFAPGGQFYGDILPAPLA